MEAKLLLMVASALIKSANIQMSQIKSVSSFKQTKGNGKQEADHSHRLVKVIVISVSWNQVNNVITHQLHRCCVRDNMHQEVITKMKLTLINVIINCGKS